MMDALDDITQRLRISSTPESVERERWMAGELYGRGIAAESEGRKISRLQMERLAKQSIEAACVFWQEWDIAVLTPDINIPEQESEQSLCVGEMR